jgi:hypothetical protein
MSTQVTPAPGTAAGQNLPNIHPALAALRTARIAGETAKVAKAAAAKVAEAGQAEHRKDQPALEAKLVKVDGQIKGLDKDLASYQFDAGRIIFELRQGYPIYGGGWDTYFKNLCKTKLNMAFRTGYSYMNLYVELNGDDALVKAAVAAGLDINKKEPRAKLVETKEANPTATPAEICNVANSKIAADKKTADDDLDYRTEEFAELKKDYAGNENVTIEHVGKSFQVWVKDVQAKKLPMTQPPFEVTVKMQSNKLLGIEGEVTIGGTRVTTESVRIFLAGLGVQESQAKKDAAGAGSK